MRDNKTPASQKTALAHSIICVFASAAFFIILGENICIMPYLSFVFLRGFNNPVPRIAAKHNSIQSHG
jgi:hypothetical protein